jgi:hypothetical protein
MQIVKLHEQPNEQSIIEQSITQSIIEQSLIEQSIIEYKQIYDNMKFINNNWVKIYDSLTILPNGRNKMKFEFNMLCDNVKVLKLQNKLEYKQWAQINNEEINPEIKYNADGWENYYHFLNIDISKFPKSIEELKKICIENNIKNKDIYDKNAYKLNLPSMPEELYKLQSKGKGKITLCRDTKRCFINGQQIKHTIRCSIDNDTYNDKDNDNKGQKNKYTIINKTRLCIYDSKTNLLKFNGKYLTMNQFVKTHYELERPDRTSCANAWAECECKINDKWVSTHNLPDISNNFIQFLL